MSEWGAQPPLPTDTDPQVPDDWLQPDVDEQVDAAFDEGWSSGFGAGVGIRPWLVIGFAIANLLIGFWFAVSVAHAAPRSAPDPVMSFEDMLPAVQGPSGVPRIAPLPSPTSDPGPAPAPAAGAIGSPLQGVRGVASWCAPTPKYCHGWGGHALVGAVPTFHSGDRPYIVRVTTRAGHHVDVRVVSFCACGPGKVIDLSPWAFRQLAPLGRGTVPVTVTWGWPIPGPPATDVGP